MVTCKVIIICIHIVMSIYKSYYYTYQDKIKEQINLEKAMINLVLDLKIVDQIIIHNAVFSLDEVEDINILKNLAAINIISKNS